MGLLYDMIPFSKEDLARWEALGVKFPKPSPLVKQKDARRQALDAWLEKQVRGGRLDRAAVVRLTSV